MFCLEEKHLRNHRKPVIQSFEYNRRVNCENKKERRVENNAMRLLIFILPRKTFLLVHFKQGPSVIDYLICFLVLEKKTWRYFPSLPASFSPPSLNLKPHCIRQTPHLSCGQREWCNCCRWAAVRLTAGGRGVRPPGVSLAQRVFVELCDSPGCGAETHGPDWQKPPAVPPLFDGAHMWNCPGVKMRWWNQISWDTRRSRCSSLEGVWCCCLGKPFTVLLIRSYVSVLIVGRIWEAWAGPLGGVKWVSSQLWHFTGVPSPVFRHSLCSTGCTPKTLAILLGRWTPTRCHLWLSFSWRVVTSVWRMTVYFLSFL